VDSAGTLAIDRVGPDTARPIGNIHGTTGRSRWVRAAVLTLIGLLATWSWLFVVSKWGPANRIDILTFKAGLTSKIMRTLLRDGQGTGGHSHSSAMISGVLATPTYFAMTEQSRDADTYLPDKFTVFYLFEDIHVGQLSRKAPMVHLRLGDGRELQPIDTSVIRDSFHHRATVARFPKVESSSLTLVAHDAAAHVEKTMNWRMPIVYPNDLQEGTDLSLPTLFALLAGLLAVLSPCLLQLTIYYTFALAGMSMQPQAASEPGARAQVIRTALYFIAGFTIVFTAAGSLAGFAGQALQASEAMEAWNRPLGVAAGVGILLLGVWVGANSGAPGLCRLPGFAVRRTGSALLDGLKAMFLGSAFAIGCSTCFGGALFISLMIYVGAVGSAWLGALALFLFSLGIAVPYLLAAFFLSRALPLLGSLSRAASGIGLVCSIALTFFGVILITDNFHIPSDFLYRLLLAG
jgi:cytochrome c biogenesis protein CcdA